MIDIETNKFYHLVINGTKVSTADYFRFACYTAFEGDSPLLFKKKEYKTSVIDLTQSLDEITSKMKSNYRNEVNRAGKEGVEFLKTENVDEFVEYYNDFATKRGLSLISVNHITKYHNIVLTKAVLGDLILAYHVTYMDNDIKKASLLYSASNRLSDNVDTKLIGFANKYLHVKEFELFKSLGYEVYDFSGLVEDPNNKQEYGIGLFKKGFGGEIIECKTYYSPLMALAMLFKKH